MSENYWSQMLSDPLPGRVAKPRLSGLTMVIDTGLPLSVMRDLLQTGAEYVDFWKFGFASSSVYPSEVIANKISLCQEYGVLAYSGGTSLEIAFLQGIWQKYVDAQWAAGIRVLEVSDGTIDLPLKVRRDMIRAAHAKGFTVLSEVGKKQPGRFLPVGEQSVLIQGDLRAGADYIIVEGREGGMGVGVYDTDGNVRENDVQALLNALGPLSTRLIWEAPLKKQQIYYVNTLSNRVNLGNVYPLDLVPLESLRRGLRSDTLSPSQYATEGISHDSGALNAIPQNPLPNAWTAGTSGNKDAWKKHPPRPTLWVDKEGHSPNDPPRRGKS
ncbi:phosphosulfolactate synthase [Alicyclobacillaceae bacterium I2511]|nr:phosphosulfolactate synthase [Alicyclobacillaceae bacterium I2511]